MTLLQLKYLIDDIVENNGDADLHISTAPVVITMGEEKSDIFLDKYFCELDNIQLCAWRDITTNKIKYYTIYLQEIDLNKVERVNQC